MHELIQSLPVFIRSEGSQAKLAKLLICIDNQTYNTSAIVTARCAKEKSEINTSTIFTSLLQIKVGSLKTAKLISSYKTT
jgi:hypothetical protein